MGSHSDTASYQVINLVREAIKTAHWPRPSDAAVARALGIKPGTVGGYKSGREFMSAATLEKAQKLMQLSGPQLAEIYVAISYEASKERGAETVWQAVRDMVRGNAASILLAACIAWAPSNDAAALENTAVAHTAPPAATSEECILSKVVRGFRKAGRWLRDCFVPPLLPAQLSIA